MDHASRGEAVGEKLEPSVLVFSKIFTLKKSYLFSLSSSMKRGNDDILDSFKEEEAFCLLRFFGELNGINMKTV